VSDHASNYLPLDGKLPEAKEHFLEIIDGFMRLPLKQGVCICNLRDFGIPERVERRRQMTAACGVEL